MEVDEAKFVKRKYQRGRLVEGQWVLGAFVGNPDKYLLFPWTADTAQHYLGLLKNMLRRKRIS